MSVILFPKIEPKLFTKHISIISDTLIKEGAKEGYPDFLELKEDLLGKNIKNLKDRGLEKALKYFVSSLCIKEYKLAYSNSSRIITFDQINYDRIKMLDTHLFSDLKSNLWKGIINHLKGGDTNEYNDSIVKYEDNKLIFENKKITLGDKQNKFCKYVFLENPKNEPINAVNIEYSVYENAQVSRDSVRGLVRAINNKIKEEFGIKKEILVYTSQKVYRK